MDIHKIKDLSEEDRAVFLQGESIPGVEEQLYPRMLADAEIAAEEKAIAQYSIQIAAIKREIADIVKAYKDRLKPLQQSFSNSIEAVKNGSVQEKGKVYRIPDHDTRMVHLVSEHGTVIQTRQMKPEERQYFMRLSTPTINQAI